MNFCMFCFCILRRKEIDGILMKLIDESNAEQEDEQSSNESSSASESSDDDDDDDSSSSSDKKVCSEINVKFHFSV